MVVDMKLMMVVQGDLSLKTHASLGIQAFKSKPGALCRSAIFFINPHECLANLCLSDRHYSGSAVMSWGWKLGVKIMMVALAAGSDLA